MRSRGPSKRWPVVLLSVFALLFAPAGDDGPSGSTGVARELVDPRIIAPTVREGIVAGNAKLTSRHGQVTDRRIQTDPVLVVLASAAAVLLLVWPGSLTGRSAGSGPRLVAMRGRVPRAPPAFGSI